MEGLDFYFRSKRAKRTIFTKEEIRSFATDYSRQFSILKEASNILMTGTEHVLLPLKIIGCNPTLNKFFTQGANCDVEQYKGIGINFLALFHIGCKVLVNFLKESKIPDDPVEEKALRKLLTFFGKDLVDIAMLTAFKVLNLFKMYEEVEPKMGGACFEGEIVESDKVQFQNEAHVCLFLMNHLISELSAFEDWKLDKGTKGRVLKCPCSRIDCPLKRPSAEDYEDLSIGNIEVWHGTIDAMTFYGKLPCVVLEGGAGDEEESDMSNKSYCCLEFEEESFTGKRSQIFAETIVFSFLSKNCNSCVSFVPVLGVRHNAVKVVMYDAALDVLLSTVEIKFKSTAYKKLSYVAYLIIWLTCNFQTFATPLNHVHLETLKTKTAGFKAFARDRLGIYHDGLQFKNVRRKTNEKELELPEDTSEVLGTDPLYEVPV